MRQVKVGCSLCPHILLSGLIIGDDQSMADVSHRVYDLGGLLPSEMARACESAGVTKASRDWMELLVLGVLAGAFIALGAIFMTVVATGSGDLPFGVARLLTGLAFSLGLIVVVVGGAELFTGDVLMIVAYASGRVSTRGLLRAWFLVYTGNIVGAIGTALLMVLAGHEGLFDGRVGNTALTIANAKAALPAVQLFFPAIAAFVTAGFEHSIANLYLLPYALMVKALARAEFWAVIGQAPSAYGQLSVANALHNIAISTLGNLIGGSVLVGIVYWFVYLRPSVGRAGSVEVRRELKSRDRVASSGQRSN